MRKVTHGVGGGKRVGSSVLNIGTLGAYRILEWMSRPLDRGAWGSRKGYGLEIQMWVSPV